MKSKFQYSVWLSYDAKYYFSENLDRTIEKMAHKSRSGSGMGFGERDMDFTFNTIKGAENLVERLKKFAKANRRYKIGIRNITVYDR